MTTIIAVRRDGEISIGGDGQATFGGRTILKHNIKKIRKINNGKVITGFAGSVVDAITLYKMLEKELEIHRGKLLYAATEILRKLREKDTYKLDLDAGLIAIDQKNIILLYGTGEVLEVEEDFVAIGSGGNIAAGAAKALLRNSSLSSIEIVKESLSITSDFDVFTNNTYIIETI